MIFEDFSRRKLTRHLCNPRAARFRICSGERRTVGGIPFTRGPLAYLLRKSTANGAVLAPFRSRNSPSGILPRRPCGHRGASVVAARIAVATEWRIP
jgi:hypothetical protein